MVCAALDLVPILLLRSQHGNEAGEQLSSCSNSIVMEQSSCINSMVMEPRSSQVWTEATGSNVPIIAPLPGKTWKKRRLDTAEMGDNSAVADGDNFAATEAFPLFTPGWLSSLFRNGGES